MIDTKTYSQKMRLAGDQAPIGVPVQTGVVLWLLLDRLQSPGWVWGVSSTLYGLYVLSEIMALFRCRIVKLRPEAVTDA